MESLLISLGLEIVYDWIFLLNIEYSSSILDYKELFGHAIDDSLCSALAKSATATVSYSL